MRSIATISTFVAISLIGQVVMGGASRAQTQQVRSVTIQALPIGQWCGRAATFVVSFFNAGSSSYYFGVPDKSGSKWPYGRWTYAFTFDRRGLGGGAGVCGMEGIDYELCATPGRAVELGSGRTMAWTLELEPHELPVGPAEFHATLYWFGAGTADEALRLKSSGDISAALSISRTNDRCVVAQTRRAG